MSVIGIPADAKRLEIARGLGVHSTLGARGEDIPDWVRNFGDGYGFDVVVDAAGVSAALKLAMEIVRPAGQIVKVGWGPQPLGFSLDPLVAKAVTLQGSFSHNWAVWEKVVSLMASGQLNLDLVLNRIAPFRIGGRSSTTCTTAGLSKECSGRESPAFRDQPVHDLAADF